jgi:hypothetical protein
MALFWKALVVLLLTLPVGAYVAGGLAGPRAELPDRRPPVLVEDPAPVASSGSSTPSESPSDGVPAGRDGDEGRDGRGGDDDDDDVRVVRPDPDDLDDDQDDDRDDDRDDHGDDAGDDHGDDGGGDDDPDGD